MQAPITNETLAQRAATVREMQTRFPGNAYRYESGVLMTTARLVDGGVDENAWTEVDLDGVQ